MRVPARVSPSPRPPTTISGRLQHLPSQFRQKTTKKPVCYYTLRPGAIDPPTVPRLQIYYSTVASTRVHVPRHDYMPRDFNFNRTAATRLDPNLPFLAVSPSRSLFQQRRVSDHQRASVETEILPEKPALPLKCPPSDRALWPPHVLVYFPS